MNICKLYDACCDACGNWYGSLFEYPKTNSEKEAIKEMMSNGWKEKDGKTLCQNCN